MRIGLLGDRNHAAHMLRLIGSDRRVTSLLIYHPDPSRANAPAPSIACPVERTSDISILSKCDAIVIASPSPTHAGFLRKFVPLGKYVLCEKPPVADMVDLEWLRGLSMSDRARTLFNFNYTRTGFAEEAKRHLADGSLGAPLHLSFVATLGLAFKSSFADNWRLRDPGRFSSVVGNLGIHYVHLAIHLLGKIESVVMTSTRHGPNTATVDSASLFLIHETGASTGILLSYAAPYADAARLVFTDGILDLDDGKLSRHGPRDCFDDAGYFTKPPSQLISDAGSSRSYYEISLQRMIDRFLEVVDTEGAFSGADFQTAIDATEVILRLPNTVERQA